jgi:magnesium transporter
MSSDRNRILIDSIRRLIRRGASSHLRKIVNKTHAADLSAVFRSIPTTSQRQLFNMIEDPEKKGILFSSIDPDSINDLIEDMGVDDIVEIMDHMSSDDVADIIALFPENLARATLERMKTEDSEEVEDLLRYEDDTAGGIMVPDFIALPENATAKEAIAAIQTDYPDVEMPFYLYVVDDYGRLVGVSSLRQLVVVLPETALRDFMTRDVFYVHTDVDQEEVARIVARYDILAVPVVSGNNQLVGIVTVDDIIDIIRKEATEDILKMAGAGEQFVETQTVFRSTRSRFPWLFASCIGGVIAFFVIGHFENSLVQIAYLAAFIPVVMGMGGNIGTQSSTIVVRGLATGHFNVRDTGKVVVKELTIGLLLGLVYGLIIASVAQISYNKAALAISVGLAVLSSMSLAALVGSLVPMAFERINIDPAVATGPFVTTAIDIISVFLYFKIATTLIGL